MPLQVEAGTIEQIPLGEGREFEFGAERIAIFRTRNGEVYAVGAFCPHRQGPLADGITGGSTVICPFHGRRFDLQTGNSSEGCAIPTYPVHLGENGVIMLTLPDESGALTSC